MKKEIKFKVWNKDEKRWINDDNIVFNVATGKIGYVWTDDNGISIEWDNELELVEFTGHKDKNGVEIYDGDILKIRYATGNENIALVKWGAYSDGEYVDNVECWIADDEPISDKGGLWGSSQHDFEVIGNIYENSELLK